MPAGHGSGSAVPSGQNEPAAHAKQPDLPLNGWCVPVSQLAHTDSPVLLLYVPGAHWIGAVLAVPQLLPILHSVHSPAPPRLVELE